jgi:hypothetical protein
MLAQLGSDLALVLDQPAVTRPLIERDHPGYVSELGRIAGAAAKAPALLWQAMLEVFSTCDTQTRSSQLICGFALGVKLASPDVASQLVEVVEKQAGLEELQAALYATLGVGEPEARRLLRLAEQALLPAERFRWFQYGGVLSNTPADLHAELLRAIARLPGGVTVAIELMSMRLHGLRSNAQVIDGHARAVCRELLLQVDLIEVHNNDSYRLEGLAAVALEGEGSELVAHQLCQALCAVLDKTWSVGWDWERLAGVVFRTHPIIALDAFFATSTQRGHLTLVDLFVGRHDPVRQVPEHVLLEWAASDPSQRDPWVARHIDVVTSGADGEQQLSSAAVTLLARANDRNAVLDGFARHVLPMSWTGSYEVASAGAAKMLRRLEDSSEPLLAKWAADQLQRIATRVEHERGRQRESEQAFE